MYQTVTALGYWRKGWWLWLSSASQMVQCTMFLSGIGDQVHPLLNLEVRLDLMSKSLEKGRRLLWLPPSSGGGLHETTCTWSILDIWDI